MPNSSMQFLEGTPPQDSSFSGAMQLAVLLVVFDGDAQAWATYLAQQGSSSQRRDDLPLALSIANDCAQDERLRLRLQELAKQLRPIGH